MDTLILTLPNAIQQSDGAWTRSVEVDELTGKEISLLTSGGKVKTGAGTAPKSGPRRITEILSRSTVAIGTEVRPEGKTRHDLPRFFEKHWAAAYMPDRIFALTRIRQHTLGNKYKFEDIKCPKDECGKLIPNLSVDLSSLDYTEADYAWVCAPTHTCKLPRSGDVVEWRPHKGESDENAIQQIVKAATEDAFLDIFALQIVTVNGAVSIDPTAYIGRMKGADVDFLGGQFNGHTGGLDMNVDMECPHCQHEFQRRVEPLSSGFFLPTTSSTPSSTKPRLPSGGDGASTPLNDSPSAVVSS